jgi:hypothetical protein
MDLAKVLAHLRTELDNLDVAIASLERLQQGAGARPRGRPPLRLQKVGKTAKTRTSNGNLGTRHAGEQPPTEEA